jgi:hypothetical protein
MLATFDTSANRRITTSFKSSQLDLYITDDIRPGDALFGERAQSADAWLVAHAEARRCWSW